MQTPELKFIIDRNVGKLVKRLRMAGFDAILFPGVDDAEIVDAARAEGRILLTRDRLLMKRRMIASGRVRAILVESDHIGEQVRQLVIELGLDRSRLRPFTRCLECNRRLEARDREAIRERLPPYVYLTRERFAECPACGRLYWPGTHRRAMGLEMEGLQGGAVSR